MSRLEPKADSRATGHAPVAQGIEHEFPKLGVAGSNPAGGIFISVASCEFGSAISIGISPRMGRAERALSNYPIQRECAVNGFTVHATRFLAHETIDNVSVLKNQHCW